MLNEMAPRNFKNIDTCHVVVIFFIFGLNWPKKYSCHKFRSSADAFYYAKFHWIYCFYCVPTKLG